MKRYRYLLILLGLSLYVILLSRIDLVRAWDLMRNVNLPLLAAAVVVGLPEILFKSLRLRLLGRPETSLSVADSIHIFLSGQPMALVTPGKLGDVTRVWLFKHLSKRSTPECLAVHTSDKIFDFSALAILATIGMFGWIGNGNGHHAAALSAAGGVAAGLALTLALLNPGWFKPLVKFLIRQWVPAEQADPLKHHGREFLEKLKTRLAPNHRHFLTFFLFSLLAWETAILRAWVCSSALGIPLPFGTYVLWAPLVVMVELLPISILGFGTRETALILLFPAIPQEAIVSFSLLTLLAGPVTTAMMGLPAALETLRSSRETQA